MPSTSETFRSLEIMSITAVVYVVITIVASLVLASIGRTFFRARMRLI